jgi:farnesyl diphosphate synthase/geranylgeranyl diphosphate synthase type II
MDDDDLRRGKPTCHIAFDEATAILAGDALQCLAFTILSRCEAAPQQLISLVQELALASGANGMVVGQAIDLAVVNAQPTLDLLESMHTHKTGALIEAAVVMGAISGGVTEPQTLKSLRKYAKVIGLSFQVQDDILDVITDTETLGKKQGADIARNKPTYVTLLGLEGAKSKAKDLHQQALSYLQLFGPEADTLRDLSSYIIERKA